MCWIPIHFLFSFLVLVECMVVSHPMKFLLFSLFSAFRFVFSNDLVCSLIFLKLMGRNICFVLISRRVWICFYLFYFRIVIVGLLILCVLCLIILLLYVHLYQLNLLLLLNLNLTLLVLLSIFLLILIHHQILNLILLYLIFLLKEIFRYFPLFSFFINKTF